MTKRGVVQFLASPVATIAVLAIVLVVFGSLAYNVIQKGDQAVKKSGLLDGDTDFIIQEPQLTDAEKAIDDSMRALVGAIDAISTDLPPKGGTDNSQYELFGIESIRLEHWADYDIKGYLNDVDTHSTSEEYTLEEVGALGNRIIVYGYSESSSTKKNIRDFDKIYNVGLQVKYTDGSTCHVTTYGNSANKKYSGNDLKTHDGSGCDQSPTLVQCPHVRAYYCGNKGMLLPEKSTGNENLFWDDNGNSRARTEYQVYLIDDKQEGGQYQRDTTLKVLGDYAKTGLSRAYSYTPAGWVTDEGKYDPSNPLCYDGIEMGSGVRLKCTNEGGSISECAVCGYTLPQQITTIENWIPSMGDPLYLAYYEAFPEGPEQYWTYDVGNSLWIVGTAAVIGGVSEVIFPAGGKISKALGLNKLAKELGGEVVQRLVKNTAKELVEAAGENILIKSLKQLGSKGSDFFFRRSVARDAVQEVVVERLPSEIGATLGDGLSRRLDNLIAEELEKLGEGATKEAIEDINARVVETYSANLRHDIKSYLERTGQDASDEAVERLVADVTQAVDSAMTRELSEQATQDAMDVILMKSAIAAVTEEGTVKISRKAFSEAMEKGFKQMDALNNLPNQYQKQVISAAEKKVSKMFSKSGIPKDGFMYSDEFLASLDEAIETVGVSRFEQLTTKMGSLGYKDLASGIFSGSTKPVKAVTQGITSPVAVPYLNPLKLRFWNPISQAAKQGNAMGRFAYRNRYNALIMLAVVAGYQDSINQKSSPVGVNSLAVAMPGVLGETVRPYALDAAATKYYIALHERYESVDDTPTPRFYFASPCKTDFIIREGICQCAMHPDMMTFNFGGGPITIRQGTIGATEGVDARAIGDFLGANIKLNEHNVNNYETYKQNKLYETLDASHAVKECMDRSQWESIKHHTTSGPTSYETFNTKCMVVEPVPQPGRDNYCYARFPVTNSIKNVISAGQWVVAGVSVVAEVLSVGIGTPVLIAINVGVSVGAEGAKAAVTEFFQKWPHSEPEDLVDRGIGATIDGAVSALVDEREVQKVDST